MPRHNPCPPRREPPRRPWRPKPKPKPRPRPFPSDREPPRGRWHDKLRKKKHNPGYH